MSHPTNNPQPTRAVSIAALCSLALWLAPLSAAENSFIPPHTAKYELHHGSITVGDVVLELKAEQDGSYRYSSRSKTSGFLSWFYKATAVEESHFRLTDRGIQPLSYRLDRRDGDRQRKAKLLFDWSRGRVTNQVAGTTWKLDIPVGTIDKLSVNLAVMQDLSRHENTLSYTIADGGKLKTYHFQIKGEEELTTSIGILRTIKVIRSRKKGRTTTLWCAPTLNYLPIRIERQERDDLVRMEITSLKGITTEK